MSNKYYDEFKNLKLKPMAQKMADLTYAFNQTRVPQSHYEKALSTALVELESSDLNVEVALFTPYFEMMTKLVKENPKYFFKALMLIQNGITLTKLDTITCEALEYAYQYKEKEKIKNLMNEDINERFKTFIESGDEEESVSENDDKVVSAIAKYLS